MTSRFCNHFSIIQTHYAWKMCSNYPGIKLEPALGTLEDKIEHLSSYAHVVHTPVKQVISRRRKNENVFKMSKDEKCTCKACKNTVFHCQICKFVGFLLPLSLWLLKLPNATDTIAGILTKLIHTRIRGWGNKKLSIQQPKWPCYRNKILSLMFEKFRYRLKGKRM